MDEINDLNNRNYELRVRIEKLNQTNDHLTEAFSHLFNKMENYK